MTTPEGEGLPQPAPTDAPKFDEAESQALLAADDSIAESQGLVNGQFLVFRAARDGNPSYFEQGWKLGKITRAPDEMGEGEYFAHIVKIEGDGRGSYKRVPLMALLRAQVEGQLTEESAAKSEVTEQSSSFEDGEVPEVGKEVSKEDWAAFTESLLDTIHEVETTMEPSQKQLDFLQGVINNGSRVMLDLIQRHGTRIQDILPALDSFMRHAQALSRAEDMPALARAITRSPDPQTNEDVSSLMEATASDFAIRGKNFEVSLAMTGAASAMTGLLRLASETGEKPILITTYSNEKLSNILDAKQKAEQA